MTRTAASALGAVAAFVVGIAWMLGSNRLPLPVQGRDGQAPSASASGPAHRQATRLPSGTTTVRRSRQSSSIAGMNKPGPRAADSGDTGRQPVVAAVRGAVEGAAPPPVAHRPVTRPGPVSAPAQSPERHTASALYAASDQWQEQTTIHRRNGHIDIRIVGSQDAATPYTDTPSAVAPVSPPTERSPASHNPVDCTLYRGGNSYARLILSQRGCRF